MSDATALIESFRGRRVAVLGDAMLDGYLDGFAERVCREAPVPVVRLRSERLAPGGAANMAVNLASLGAHARFVTMLGGDPDGESLRGLLDEAGVDTGGIVADTRRTTVAKRRLVADGQLLVRYDVGDTGAPSPATGRALLAALDRALAGCEALVVSDYRGGTLSPPIIEALACRRHRIPLLVVDSPALAEFRSLHPDLAKPSIAEALGQLALAPGPATSRATLAEALGDPLLDLTGAQRVALTLDEDGAVVFEPGEAPVRATPRHRGPASPAGAGDTFLAAFTLALLSGAGTAEASSVAQAAAGVVVAKEGTSVCSPDEIAASLTAFAVPVLDEAALRVRLERERSGGRRVVFTNGCFDLLHPGHVALLRAARALGDILVVAVNGDAQVRELKGPGRPVNGLDDRLRVLSAVSAIDYLVPFGERTASRLVSVLRPDVFVKGGDYTVASIPEAPAVFEAGGRVEILPYFGDDSTSALIDRIRTLPAGRVS